MLETYIGAAASFMVISATIYQILKMIKTKNTSAISYPWIGWITVSLVLWMLFGFYINNSIIFGVNLLAAQLYCMILLIKFFNERKKN